MADFGNGGFGGGGFSGSGFGSGGGFGSSNTAAGTTSVGEVVIHIRLYVYIGFGSGGGGTNRACFNCNEVGHRSAECPEPKKTRGSYQKPAENSNIFCNDAP